MSGSAPLLTAAEVMSRLKISRTTLYKLIHRGQLARPIKVGGCSRWKEEDVAALLSVRKRGLAKPKRAGETAA